MVEVIQFSQLQERGSVVLRPAWCVPSPDLDASPLAAVAALVAASQREAQRLGLLRKGCRGPGVRVLKENTQVRAHHATRSP